MSEDREVYQVQGPLYLRLLLTPKCQVELTIQGEITREAIERLKAFLDLAVTEPVKVEEDSDGE